MLIRILFLCWAFFVIWDGSCAVTSDANGILTLRTGFNCLDLLLIYSVMPRQSHYCFNRFFIPSI